MTQKEFEIPPKKLFEICKNIYRHEEFKEINSLSLIVSTSSSLSSWGEKISIEILPTSDENRSILIYKSVSKYQSVDWGKNLDNEKEFFKKLERELIDC